MELDLVEQKILQIGPLLFFFIFFFSLDLGMKILFFSAILFFLILFIICAYLTEEWYPKEKFIISFLVSFFHTFLYIFSGFLGFLFNLMVSNFLPLLIGFLKEIFRF